MMGIKGRPQQIESDRLRRLWRDTNTKSDLDRIGVEAPEELLAMFLMDGDEIDRITGDSKPLTDLYPKRLSDSTAEDKNVHAFAFEYIRSTSAAERFERSQLIEQIFPPMRSETLDPFFVIREMRYRAKFERTNWLADLDVHLRGSNLREPVLEVFGSNSFRVALAEKKANYLDSPTPEAFEDLIASALGQRNYSRAILLLEIKSGSGAPSRDDVLLLTYLYCLNGNVPKAESIASTTANRDDSLTKWLWEKLRAEYEFHPPD